MPGLRDSIESGRIPSGEVLTADAKALHERAADHFDKLVVAQADDAADEITVRLSMDQARAVIRLVDRHGDQWDEIQAAGALWRGLSRAGYEPC